MALKLRDLPRIYTVVLLLAFGTVVSPPLGEDDFLDGGLFTELTDLLIEDNEMLHALAPLTAGVTVAALKGSPTGGEGGF